VIGFQSSRESKVQPLEFRRSKCAEVSVIPESILLNFIEREEPWIRSATGNAFNKRRLFKLVSNSIDGPRCRGASKFMMSPMSLAGMQMRQAPPRPASPPLRLP